MIRPTPVLMLRSALVLLGLLGVVGLWRIVATLGLAMPLDPNEGWNAYHTASAMSGHALYPGHEAYLVNNYPPLSFYVVGLTGWMVGDYIVAGRIVSLLAVGWICAAMALSARRMGASREVSLLPPLVFHAGLILFTDYVGMDDPQMLAQAVSISGLVVLLRRPQGRFTPAAAALLFVLGFFVKHNIVALPIAATVWLAFADRRRALVLAGYGILFLAIGLVIFRLTYGVSLLSVMVTARSYSVVAMGSGLAGWLHFAGAPIIGLGVLLWLAPRDSNVRLLAIYAVIATVIGSYFLGGAGVDPNVLFEADVALALAAGLLVQRLTGWRAPAAALILAAPLLLYAAANREWQQAYLDPSAVATEAAMARSDIAFMAAQKGPGLCEMLSLCYWAGKPPAVDEFNVGQQFETGARSDSEIVRAVAAKHYAVIQFDPGEPYALGENVYNALMSAYRLHHSDDFGTFYVPK